MAKGKKCVMVIDGALPLGLIANTAAVLGATLGKVVEGMIGHDLVDNEGNRHLGITTVPIPILKADRERIREIRMACNAPEMAELVVVDFCDAAQRTKTYADYERELASTPAGELAYLGVALYGDQKKVNRLTGNLPLLR